MSESKEAFEDIESVWKKLDSAAKAYRELFKAYVKDAYAPKSADKEFYFQTIPNDVGISLHALLGGQKEFLSDCPKSLLAVNLKLSLEDWLDNSRFRVYPLLTEEDGAAPLPPSKTILPGEPLPDGYGLGAWLLSNRAGARHWLNILASIIDHYIAAVEPLLKHRIIAPTFPRDHLPLYARHKKQYQGKPAPMWKVIEDYEMRYDGFTISLDELYREAIRRMGPGGDYIPKQEESTTQTDPLDIIAFPVLRAHFKAQGWDKGADWYKRALAVKKVVPVPKKGAKGAIQYPEKIAKAAISDAITAEKQKKSRF